MSMSYFLNRNFKANVRNILYCNFTIITTCWITLKSKWESRVNVTADNNDGHL